MEKHFHPPKYEDGRTAHPCLNATGALFTSYFSILYGLRRNPCFYYVDFLPRILNWERNESDVSCRTLKQDFGEQFAVILIV
jgi:hypothetical protein